MSVEVATNWYHVIQNQSSIIQITHYTKIVFDFYDKKQKKNGYDIWIRWNIQGTRFSVQPDNRHYNSSIVGPEWIH